MLRFLHNLFFPHQGNNHRAKILHNSTLFIILSSFIFLSFFSYFLKSFSPDILGVSYSISETELLVLVNNARQEKGLAPLTLDARLSDAARRKAADMLAKNYWAHFAPDGSTSPWGFIKAAGYSYLFAGENLAKGFSDSSSIVGAWMNSPTHRENILSNKFRDVGFAVVPGSLQQEDTVLVVEMFGSRESQTLAAVPQAAESVQSVKTESTPSSVTVAQAKIQEPEPKQTKLNGISPESKKSEITSNPKVDAGITSKAVSTVGLSFMAFAFIMDLVIIERKKIPRVVGHNIDHVMLILLFLLFIVLKRSGVII